MTQENHPTMEQIAQYHLKESDAWKYSADHIAVLQEQKKGCADKAEWHLRAAAEILTHTPKAAV